MKPVVLFETLWSDPADGWSIACRGYARAMDMAGVDVRLHSWMPIQPLDQQVLDEVSSIISKPARITFPKWDFYIFSSTLSGPEQIDATLKKMILSYVPPRTFYTTFERSSIASSTATLLKQLDGIWVPCTYNAEVLRAAGVEANVIPHCFFDDDPLLRIDKVFRKPKVFYWIGRWEPRKAPDNLLRAFLRAFSPQDDVELVMKLSPLPWQGEAPTLLEIVEHEVSLSDRWTLQQALRAIQILPGKLSRKAVIELHARGDVYVSASRGEGWDLPCFEAKLSGHRVVTTDSGGPRDFLGPDDILVPAPSTIPANAGYGWGKGALYRHYDLDDLVRALRRAYDEPVPAKEWPREKFTAARVGEQLREWIEKVTFSANPATSLDPSRAKLSPITSKLPRQSSLLDGPGLCRQSDFSDDWYGYWCHLMKEPPRFHRKQWEFYFVSEMLSRHGMLRKGKRGLGFGVGREPLVPLFASLGCSVVATDMEADAAQVAGWLSDQHSSHSEELNEKEICPPKLFRKNVRFRTVDMNHVPHDLQGFDFCWSACAFEHLGSIEAGLQFVERSVDCLRPGGVAVHTTEFNLSSDDDTIDKGGTVLFRRRDVEELVSRLQARGHGVEPINFDPGNGDVDRFVDVPPYRQDYHLKLAISAYTCTSIGLVIVK